MKSKKSISEQVLERLHIQIRKYAERMPEIISITEKLMTEKMKPANFFSLMIYPFVVNNNQTQMNAQE